MTAYRFWLHVTVVVFACFSCAHGLLCTAAACRRGHGHVPGYTCCKQPDGDYKCCRFRGERQSLKICQTPTIALQVCCAQAVCPFPDLPKSCCCPEGSHCSMFSLNGCTTLTTSQLFTSTTISSTPSSSSTKTTEAATTTTALTSRTTTGLVTTSTSATMSSTTTNSQTQSSTTSTGSSSLLTTTSTASTTTESASPTTTTAARSTSLPATTSTTSTIGTSSSSTGTTTESSTSTKRSTTSVTPTTSEPGTTSTSPIKTSTSTGTTTSTGSTTTTSTQTTSLPATTSTSTIGTSSSTGSSTTTGSSTSIKRSTTTATQSTSQSATTSSSTTAKSSTTSSSSTPGTSSSTGSSTTGTSSSTGSSTSTGASTSTGTTSPPTDCYGDFLFIVPTSERLAPLIHSMLYIVLNMTTVLGAAQNGSHHALIHYSSPNWKSNVSYDFNTINTYPEIQNYITTQHWEKYVGVSDLDRGLQLGIHNVFTTQGGDRSSAPNFVVLISDGYFDQTSECCPAPFDSASALRRLADIWAVEVGPDTRPENLYKICASSGKVYPAKHSYELAQKILMELMKKCKNNISD